MGGAYGGLATDSDDPVDRAIGGTIGGLSGGTLQKVAPYATEGAKELIKRSFTYCWTDCRWRFEK